MPPGERPRPDPPPSLVGPETLRAMLTLARQAPPGPFVEVGVYKGGSAWHLGELAAEQGRELWLFDTFDGIPYASPLDSHRIGDFCDTNFYDVQGAVPLARLVAGIFPASASSPGWFPRAPIAFAHLDCDQERSYRDSIAFLRPRMAKGAYMWFDDAPCLAGATQAVVEAFETSELRVLQGKYYVKL